MGYPLDSNKKLEELKNTIHFQREIIKDLAKKPELDYYELRNPIYGNKHIFILCNQEKYRYTKIIADHFNDEMNLKLLYKKDYDQIKSNLIINIICSLSLFLIFIVVLIITFQYLEVKSLSLIPIFSLFFMTISFMILIINSIRLFVIDRVINDKHNNIEPHIIKLMLFKLIKANEQKIENGLVTECIEVLNECSKTK